MSYIDRNEQGQIVGVFANQQYEGQEYLDGATLHVQPPAPPTPLEQIRALEAQYADAQAKVTRQALLALALEKAMLLPEAVGLTQEQVHAYLMSMDNGYAALFTLEQQVEVLRAQIP